MFVLLGRIWEKLKDFTGTAWCGFGIFGIDWHIVQEIDAAVSLGILHGSTVAPQMTNSQARYKQQGRPSQCRELSRYIHDPHCILLCTPTHLPVFPVLAVTSLRKAEKAAAIKTKREEVEALRRALEKSSRQPKPIVLTAQMSGGMFGLGDGAIEDVQGDDVSELSSGPPSFRRSTRSYRQQEPPGKTADRSSSLAEALNTCDGDVEQIKPEGDADQKSQNVPTTPMTPRHLESSVPHVQFGDRRSQGGHGKSLDSRSSPGDRFEPRPPAADVSPPLSARTPGWKEERRRWCEVDGGTPGRIAKGEAVTLSEPKGIEDPPPARGGKYIARVEPAEQVPAHTDQDETVISDNPLHR